MLTNLLGNAVKFTPDGGRIEFTVTDIPSLRDGIMAVRFAVRDNGIGIPKASLPSIFDSFMRVDDTRVSKIEGTGLGLSICKSYVNAMGGAITCESEEGKGSVFTVELFFEETEAKPAETETLSCCGETPFIGKRCLLCEDNDTNQLIAQKLLERILSVHCMTLDALPSVWLRRKEVSMIGQMDAATPTGKRTYSVDEVREILGIIRRKAYELCNSDVCKVIWIGRALRVSKASFDFWLDHYEHIGG